MKLLISPDGHRYWVDKGVKVLHVSDGAIDLNKAKPWSFVKTNKGVRYAVVEPDFTDILLSSDRGPQVVLPKDAAAIVAHTGLGAGDKVVDAGAGSGWLAAFLGKVVGEKGKVISYEIRKEFADLAEKNLSRLGMTNVKVKREDITKGIMEKNLDLITLDLLTPTKVRGIAKALKPGKYCVAYVPHLNQAQEFAVFAEKQNLLVDKVVETREKTWLLKEGNLKKRKNKIKHTGYLVFARKITR